MELPPKNSVNHRRQPGARSGVVGRGCRSRGGRGSHAIAREGAPIMFTRRDLDGFGPPRQTKVSGPFPPARPAKGGSPLHVTGSVSSRRVRLGLTIQAGVTASSTPGRKAHYSRYNSAGAIHGGGDVRLAESFPAEHGKWRRGMGGNSLWTNAAASPK